MAGGVWAGSPRQPPPSSSESNCSSQIRRNVVIAGSVFIQSGVGGSSKAARSALGQPPGHPHQCFPRLCLLLHGLVVGQTQAASAGDTRLPALPRRAGASRSAGNARRSSTAGRYYSEQWPGARRAHTQSPPRWHPLHLNERGRTIELPHCIPNLPKPPGHRYANPKVQPAPHLR